MKTTVIIPTLNAAGNLEALLTALERQTTPPAEILLIDSASTDATARIADSHPGVRLLPISRERFNHGGTRDLGARETSGESIVFMTQDALPANHRLLENLNRALADHPRAAAAYGQQLPREDARPREKLVRYFSYPADGAVHDRASVRTLGLRAFYLSNVCAVYRREVYEALGGFEKDLRSNEDMLFAARAIQAGYSVVYAPEAQVIHSHNLSFGEQYRRNRLQGYELARHRALLVGDSPASSGMELLRFVSRGLLRQGRILSLGGFCLDCAARYAGNRAGKREYDQQAVKEQNTEEHRT